MSVATLAVRTLRSARYSPMSLMLLGVLALSGCSMVPEYRQPELPVAAQWDGTPDSQSAPGGQWWREFHSTELDSLITRGLASNYTLKAAVSRIDEARASAQVVGAGQYPALNLGAISSVRTTTAPRQNAASLPKPPTRWISGANSVRQPIPPTPWPTPVCSTPIHCV